MVGARASGGCSSISGRCRPTATLTAKLTATAAGPRAPATSHWPRRRSSIEAPIAPIPAQIAPYSPRQAECLHRASRSLRGGRGCAASAAAPGLRRRARRAPGVGAAGRSACRPGLESARASSVRARAQDRGGAQSSRRSTVVAASASALQRAPVVPAPGVDLLGALEVMLERLRELAGEALVPDAQGDLVVELKRAVVEVDGADRRPGAVDAQRLRVQHRRLVLEHPHTRLEQLVVGRPACDPDEGLVDVRPRDEDPHRDAALCRRAERLGERRPGDEVGGGELDRLARGGDRQVVERLDVGVADRRARSERAASGRRRSTGSSSGRYSSPASTSPVASSQFSAKAPCMPADDRAADADVGVAPVVGVLGVAGPLRRDPDAAGHPDPAVGDQQPAVGAVGEPPDRVRLRRPEEDHARRPASRISRTSERSIFAAPSASRITLQRTPVARLVADRLGDVARRSRRASRRRSAR